MHWFTAARLSTLYSTAHLSPLGVFVKMVGFRVTGIPGQRGAFGTIRGKEMTHLPSLDVGPEVGSSQSRVP